jgi:hypothetical protein
VNSNVLSGIVVTGLLMLIPLYFESRRDNEPTGSERFLARTWLFVRRCLCFLAAMLFGALAIHGVLGLVGVTRDSPPLGVALFSGAMAGVFIWWGIFGAGRSRTFSDDRPEHERRRRRYGWRK